MSPDVVEDESAGAGVCSDVGSKEQLVIHCHTQVLCSPSQGHHRALNVDGEVTDRRFLPCEEKQLGLVEVELQVVVNRAR